jgi:hypothetical protein
MRMDRLMAAQQNLIPLIQYGGAQGTGHARARHAPVAICDLTAFPGACGP